MAEQQADYRVFVSYSRKDLKLVSPVARLIEAIIPEAVFQDSVSIKLGRKWSPQLAEALHKAQTVVVFWCCHSKASSSVKDEYTIAIEDDKDVLPVKLDDTPLPDTLSQYQGLDFSAVVKHRSSLAPRKVAIGGTIIAGVLTAMAVVLLRPFVLSPVGPGVGVSRCLDGSTDTLELAVRDAMLSDVAGLVPKAPDARPMARPVDLYLRHADNEAAVGVVCFNDMYERCATGAEPYSTGDTMAVSVAIIVLVFLILLVIKLVFALVTTRSAHRAFKSSVVPALSAEIKARIERSTGRTDS